MSSRSVTSSDLELARTLSRRLSGAQTSGQPPAPTGPGYVRFAPRPIAAVPVAAQPAGVTVELVRFDTWDKLLDSCLSLTRATTAFVMDPEGFAIAHRGALSMEEIQGLGSQLMVAMSEADRLEHPGTPALSVCVEFETIWVTGIRVVGEGRGAFTMGFIAAAPVDRDARNAITLQVTHNLEHL